MDSALTEFTIANFRSIYRPQTIKFNLGEAKTFAIYGQNASGKSNILKALRIMTNIIIHSADASYELPFDFFHYSKTASTKPTIFSIEVKSKRYTLNYTFAYNQIKILYEVLRQKSDNTNKYKTLFLRKEQEIINPSAINFGFTPKLIERTLEKTLLITKAYEDNNPYAKTILETIHSIEFASMESRAIENKVATILDIRPDIKDKVLNALSDIEGNIADIKTTHIKLSDSLNEAMNSQSLLRQLLNSYTDVKIVRKYGETEYHESFNDESSGTRAIISILTMLQYATENNLMLCMDEFGNFIHPRNAAKIINYYENLHPRKCFLISTHQLGLYDCIGRAERIIVSKNHNTGETRIEQRKATRNPRALKEDRREADNYFISTKSKNIAEQSSDNKNLFESLFDF